jgi:DNA topoisomerase-2
MSLLDDNDEEEARQRRPPKMRAAPAPATKLPPKAESGSDIQMAEDRHSRPSQPKKSSVAKTRKESDDEDSGDDLVRCALEKGKGKPRAPTQVSKRKS